MYRCSLNLVACLLLVSFKKRMSMNKRVLFLSLSVLSIADIYTMDAPGGGSRKRPLSRMFSSSATRPSEEGYGTDPDMPASDMPAQVSPKKPRAMRTITIPVIINETNSMVLGTHYDNNGNIKDFMIPTLESKENTWPHLITITENKSVTISYLGKVFGLFLFAADPGFLHWVEYQKPFKYTLLQKIPLTKNSFTIYLKPASEDKNFAVIK